MTALRAGIVGTGFMGAVHAHAVRATGGTVARVVGSSTDSSRAGADRLGAEGVSASVAELVHDPFVDVVHVCAPNWLHHEVASLALTVGKPVICEKPLATTVADAEGLARIAAASGLPAVVPFVYRYHPMVREARARVRAGEVGPLWAMHGSYLQDWLVDPEDTNWRVDPTLGGASRAFADIGVHWCDLLEFVSGHRIARVAATSLTAHEHRAATEDAVALAFHTDLGAIGSALVSQVSHGRKNGLRVSLDGAHGALAFDQEVPDTLWLGRRDRTTTLHRGAADGDPDALRLSVLPPGHPQGYQDAFNGLVRDAYDAARGAEPSGLPTFADGLRAARLTEAVLTSARTQQWVDVETQPF